MNETRFVRLRLTGEKFMEIKFPAHLNWTVNELGV